MCGIAGWLELNDSAPTSDAREILARMTAALRHRGPDDEGLWFDGVPGIALGHRRLSVLDLSAAGRQPMHSACGRYVIVFNGEIYNFTALHRELEANRHCFRGGSDTEVMLAAIAA